MDKGSVHIYCGEGRGKTSAAIGQGIRAASQGKSVIIIQFLKEKNMDEIGFVRRLEPEVKLFRFEKSAASFDKLTEEEKQEEKQNLKNGLNFAKKVLVTEECDVLILDEVLGLIPCQIASVEEIQTLIRAKSEHVELILTGIYSGEELWENADNVVEMVTRK